MSPAAVIIRKIAFQDPSQMPVSQHDHAIQAVTSNRSDQPLHVGPLPWAGRSGEDLLHAHALDSLAKLTPIDLVSISQGNVVPCLRERLQLSVVRSTQPWDGPSRYSEPHADGDEPAPPRQDPKGSSRNGEEIGRNQILDMVVQESPPSLGRRLPVLRHEAGNRALGNLHSQFEQFPVNASRAPIRVSARHPLD